MTTDFSKGIDLARTLRDAHDEDFVAGMAKSLATLHKSREQQDWNADEVDAQWLAGWDTARSMISGFSDEKIAGMQYTLGPTIYQEVVKQIVGIVRVHLDTAREPDGFMAIAAPPMSWSYQHRMLRCALRDSLPDFHGQSVLIDGLIDSMAYDTLYGMDIVRFYRAARSGWCEGGMIAHEALAYLQVNPRPYTAGVRAMESRTQTLYLSAVREGVAWVVASHDVTKDDREAMVERMMRHIAAGEEIYG